MLPGTLVTVPDGARGFDCDATITPALADAFVAKGYQFAARYVRRQPFHPEDLTTSEAMTILGAGLALVAVQHVESATSWVPTLAKGAAYGRVAVSELARIGFPPGAMCWCDLEGVAVGTAQLDVINYVNAWYDAVRLSGFLPGLYVGWRCGLTARQLYARLRMQHYWGAYNLDVDERPLTRSVQMQQHAALADDRPVGVAMTFPFDVNITHADALGGRVALLAPASS